MTNEQHDRLGELFELAIELSPAARERFIAARKFIDIERCCRRPGTERNICNCGMERMPKPGAVKKISYLFSQRCVFQEEGIGDRPEDRFYRFEPLLTTDEISQFVHASDSEFA